MNIKESKIQQIKALVERIQKVTGKKIVFENQKEVSKPKIESGYASVAKDTGKREIEKWLGEMPKAGTGAKGSGDNTAESLIKSLKDAGFMIVKKNDVETKASSVNENKKLSRKKIVKENDDINISNRILIGSCMQSLQTWADYLKSKEINQLHINGINKKLKAIQNIIISD